MLEVLDAKQPRGELLPASETGGEAAASYAARYAVRARVRVRVRVSLTLSLALALARTREFVTSGDPSSGAGEGAAVRGYREIYGDTGRYREIQGDIRRCRGRRS